MQWREGKWNGKGWEGRKWDYNIYSSPVLLTIMASV